MPPNNQQQRRYQAPPVDDARVVRPQPHIEDPRAFQVGQIERRYKPKVTQNERESTYTFKMSPSDPDFPYEIEALECTLVVPKTYPETGRPSLRALNKDIPRGFQINIEKGFDIICAEAPQATLLGLMNRLDKQLESILAGEMAETIKLVVHKGPPSRIIGAKPTTAAPVAPPEPAIAAKPKPKPVLPVFTSQQ
jgi:hypothetical protein